jgi:hypothetical protein
VSPRDVERAAVAMIMRADQEGVCAKPVHVEEFADDDAPAAPPAAPVNGEEFDPEPEARRAYFDRMARATS